MGMYDALGSWNNFLAVAKNSAKKILINYALMTYHIIWGFPTSSTQFAKLVVVQIILKMNNWACSQCCCQILTQVIYRRRDGSKLYQTQGGFTLNLCSRFYTIRALALAMGQAPGLARAWPVVDLSQPVPTQGLEIRRLNLSSDHHYLAQIPKLLESTFTLWIIT